VYGVAFSPDGRHLACGVAGDNAVQVWDVAAAHQIRTLHGHIGLVFCVAYSPGGRRLVSGSRDTTVKVWDTADGQEVLTLKGHGFEVLDVAFSPDGRRLASAGTHDRMVRVWDIGPPPGWYEELARLENGRAALTASAQQAGGEGGNGRRLAELGERIAELRRQAQ
jgi:WD40 repeat protein